MDALSIIGPFLGVSGYAHHVRAFVRELHRRGIAIHLQGHPAWPTLGPDPTDDERFFASLSEPVQSKLLLHFCMPQQVSVDLAYVNLNHTMFETTAVPAAWVKIAASLPMTMLPTQSGIDAWRASGAPAGRLRKAPLGIDPARFRKVTPPLPLATADGTQVSAFTRRFLNVSAWGPRKNLVALIRTWCAATNANDDAVLILKLTGTEEIVREQFEGMCRLVETATKRPLATAAPVIVIYKQLSETDMDGLYSGATHYISLSHGEGWDLPMMEAIGSGLIPIAPDHSAYQEYLDETIAHLVPSTVGKARVPFDGHPGALFAGLDWWFPDESVAADYIRGIIDGTLAPVESGRERILTEYSWERSTDQLLLHLEEAMTMESPRSGWRSRFQRRR